MRQGLASAVVALGLGVTACSGPSPSSGPPPAPTTGLSRTPAAAPGASVATPAGTTLPSVPPSSRPRPTAATIVEPTTTNTLPPPPAPTAPAPSTAGALTAKALPVPTGWQTVARSGGAEEGVEGNGTWVQGRDPRYAAEGVVTVGCAGVTRDDYPDPIGALQGTYERKRQPGVGIALQFATEAKARAFWRVYLAQVKACARPGGPVRTSVLQTQPGLIDHRSGRDGEWTEVGARHHTRVTLVILGDPGHRIGRASSRRLLTRLSS